MLFLYIRFSIYRCPLAFPLCFYSFLACDCACLLNNLTSSPCLLRTVNRHPSHLLDRSHPKVLRSLDFVLRCCPLHGHYYFDSDSLTQGTQFLPLLHPLYIFYDPLFRMTLSVSVRVLLFGYLLIDILISSQQYSPMLHSL